MQVKDIAFGGIAQLKQGGNVYKRINVSRNILPREPNQTVLINAVTGKVRLVGKDRDAFAV